MEVGTSRRHVVAGGAGRVTRRPSAVVVRQTGLALDRVLGESIVTRTREYERALLASAAMEHIAALSALEAQCIEMAPLADARLKVVGDAFAMAAAQAVANYGR